MFSVLGGLLADWLIGKYKTILWLSIVYVMGHVCLAVFDVNLNGFMFGLFLIALGSGGIKPCVSANVGDQFDKTNQYLIPKLYSIFYFSINFGALFFAVGHSIFKGTLWPFGCLWHTGCFNGHCHHYFLAWAQEVQHGTTDR